MHVQQLHLKLGSYYLSGVLEGGAKADQSTSSSRALQEQTGRQCGNAMLAMVCAIVCDCFVDPVLARMDSILTHAQNHECLPSEGKSLCL